MKTGIKNEQLIPKENRNYYIIVCFIKSDFVGESSNDIRGVWKREGNHNVQVLAKHYLFFLSCSPRK